VTEVSWRPSPRLTALATAALLALAAALITGRAALLLLEAPALGALAAMPRGQRPVGVDVAVDLIPARCFEGDDVRLRVSVTATVPLDEVTFVAEPASGMSLAAGTAAQTRLGVRHAAAAWTLRPRRWGRREPATVTVTCRCGNGAWQTSLLVQPAALDVFPRASGVRPRQVPPELLRRIGEHASRATGEGAEFAGIRPYVTGDPLRDVNRAVSIRRRQWRVNQRVASRAADLVLVVDVLAPIFAAGSYPLACSAAGSSTASWWLLGRDFRTDQPS
jgi:uncharacterized protein (DUF58 family)